MNHDEFLDEYFEGMETPQVLGKAGFRTLLHFYDKWVEKKLLQERFPGPEKPRMDHTGPDDMKVTFHPTNGEIRIKSAWKDHD